MAADRVCACPCDRPLDGMRADARWYSDACMKRWMREHPGQPLSEAHSTDKALTRPRTRPSGAQVSYFKAVDVVADTLRAYGIDEARAVARTALRRALPARQRERLEGRAT